MYDNIINHVFPLTSFLNLFFGIVAEYIHDIILDYCQDPLTNKKSLVKKQHGCRGDEDQTQFAGSTTHAT